MGMLNTIIAFDVPMQMDDHSRFCFCSEHCTIIFFPRFNKQADNFRGFRSNVHISARSFCYDIEI